MPVVISNDHGNEISSSELLNQFQMSENQTLGNSTMNMIQTHFKSQMNGLSHMFTTLRFRTQASSEALWQVPQTKWQVP